MADLILGSTTAITESGGALTYTQTGGLQTRQVFTSSDTWTKPPGITTIKIQVQGSGGGGGGWQCGGGAGGYGEKVIDVTSITSEVVTVGEPGAGATAPTNAGGTVSFGSHVTATGGQVHHSSTTNNAGRGGSCSGGDINMKGGGAPASHDGGATLVSGGGSSFFGGGPPGRYNAVPADGNTDGGAYGTGGASSDAGGDGGNGVKGVIIVEEYA